MSRASCLGAIVLIGMLIVSSGCNQNDSISKSNRPAPASKQIMTTVTELSTRSGIILPVGATIMSQEDNLGAVQKSQGWVVKLPAAPTAPATALKKVDNEASESLRVMKNATPDVDFGQLVGNTAENARWEMNGDSWTMAIVKTTAGTFALIDWIKQN